MLMIAVAFMNAALLADINDFDCQVYTDRIKNWNVLTLGGFTFAKAISVDLAPTNAPCADARYSVRCQIVYKNNGIPRPRSEDEFSFVLLTSDLLNAWLESYISGRYAGMEYEDLVELYLAGDDKGFTSDVNAGFLENVDAQISMQEPSERFDLDAVTVVVEAEGAFRDDLERIAGSLPKPVH